MNGKRPTQPQPLPPVAATSKAADSDARPPAARPTPPRHVHRQRDFGVGYGNSSGYDDGLHYVDGHVDPMFRCS